MFPLKRIESVLSHGQFVRGPEVRELEAAMAEYVGVKYAVSCNSGTDALIFSLKASGIEPGMNVLVPAFTFSATAAAVMAVGANLHFADISEDDFGLDIESAALEGIDCVIAVDMFGIPCDWSEIHKVCNWMGIVLIEDAAQAIGATYYGDKCGSLAEVACTSFYPSKPLPACGDGGMLFTDQDSLAMEVFKRCNHGRARDSNPYIATEHGLNSRLDTIQAAILLDRLSHFEAYEVHSRRSQALWFSKHLPGKHYIQDIAKEPIWSWYPVLYESRHDRDDALRQYSGHGARVIYPVPLHLQPAFEFTGHARGSFPVAESVCERILAFPIAHHWEVNSCLSMITNAENASTVLK